jgi:hypothetical protein
MATWFTVSDMSTNKHRIPAAPEMEQIQASFLLASLARRKAKEAAKATEDRNEAIHKMRDDGASLRTIAETVGLSHTAVAKILDRP